MVSHRWQVLGWSLAALLGALPARGADWASTVLNYSAGFTYPSPDPNNFSFVPPTGGVDVAYAGAISGQLDGITGDTGFGVLTPFNGAFSPSQYVGVGQGGSITLQFASPVKGTGFALGIHTASGLIDFAYPNGSAGATATPYTTPRRAMVEVSADGNVWKNLGTFDLNNPSNFYATGVTTPGFQSTVSGGTLADVQKPFTGSLSSFNGENWNGMLTTLNGSAGGNWVDVSSSGLSSVGYVRLSVPNGSILYLDGVVGVPAAAAPEPASLGVMGLGVVGLLLRRRRGR